MNLECLANELLLHLFEFLNGVGLFRAFHSLNSRFSNLLFIYNRFHCIRLILIKNKYHLIFLLWKY